MPSIFGIVIGLAIVAALMTPLERLWPSVRGQRVLRRGWKVDLVYWLFTPLVTRVATRFVVGALLVLAVAVFANGVTVESLMAGHGPIGRQPKWLQAIELLLVIDFVGYWMHRWFHGGWRWRFHAVHHSSVELDWLSSVRLHPVNDLLTRIAQVAVAIGLGFAPLVLASAAPLLTLWAIYIHANVGWDLGRLRAVIASPRFHRWHHTSAAEGRDSNFAGLFPVWDILFGTYYMPATCRRTRRCASALTIRCPKACSASSCGRSTGGAFRSNGCRRRPAPSRRSVQRVKPDTASSPLPLLFPPRGRAIAGLRSDVRSNVESGAGSGLP